VSLCDELRGAALHAARVRSVACYVPLLKHGHVSVAVRRHAIRVPAHRRVEARRVLHRLGGRQAHGRGRCGETNESSADWAACAPDAPPLLNMERHWFQREPGNARLR